MATGSPFFARTQSFSHWSSCGQTRPQTAGSALSVFRIRFAAATSPSLILRMNCGICTSTGQPWRHGAVLHWRQRDASTAAVSGE